MDGKKALLWGIGFAIVVVSVVAIGQYVSEFPDASENPENWAWFGSYLGGVLGPLFSLLSMVIVVYSIESGKKQQALALQVPEALKVFRDYRDHFNALLDVEFKYTTTESGHPLNTNLRGVLENIHRGSTREFWEDVEKAAAAAEEMIEGRTPELLTLPPFRGLGEWGVGFLWHLEYMQGLPVPPALYAGDLGKMYGALLPVWNQAPRWLDSVHFIELESIYFDQLENMRAELQAVRTSRQSWFYRTKAKMRKALLGRNG